jgi:hypothetical protein
LNRFSEKFDPELLVSDLMMPERYRFALRKAYLKDDYGKKFPVSFLSSLSALSIITGGL